MCEDHPYQISVITTDDDFTSLQPTWQAIESADSEATPFNTFQWLSLWWKFYQSPEMEMHVVQFALNGEVVGIAPMYLINNVRYSFLKQRELRWMGSGADTSPDYLNVVCLSEHRTAVIECFATYLIRCEDAARIRLSDIANPSELYAQLQKTLSSQKGQVHSSVTNTIFISQLPDTWDEYRLALSRKRRKAINHRRNRLDQAGEWSLDICDSDEQRHAAVEALEELHRQRWVSKGAPGGFLSDGYINFHRSVIESFTKTDQLWLVTLSLNSEIIGVLYLFNWRGTLMFFQSGFSPDHEALSPGHVMLTYVMGEAIERGIKNIDLLKGDYPYKTVYAKEVRETSDIIYDRAGIVGVIDLSKRFVKSYRKAAN